MYWNHNSAYYPWIKKKTADCHHILDVGCGDGSLMRYLDDGKKEVCRDRSRPALHYRYLLEWMK
ncbi:MAG: hypothetical protein IKE21_02845 [Erysipelotrichaceae bacterium]|nr:hypothetical protein [Erysipelotrichaceae bacterium]